MANSFSFAFGTKTSFEQAPIIIIPVPWEVTASYGAGASQGPELIRRASSQMDFFQKHTLRAHNHFIHFHNEDSVIQNLNQKALVLAQKIKDHWEENKILTSGEQKELHKVNQLCEQMVKWVYDKSSDIYSKEKIPVVVGGDHSVSEGILQFLGDVYRGDYGVLHIDAHPDLRCAYQGFTYSHASVMYNALSHKFSPTKLVQIGIRDFSQEEYNLIQNDSRITCYYDEDLKNRLFCGDNWADLSREIVADLPPRVYVSLDIDGLSWECAMGTGTPVPGGLSFSQLVFLLRELERQKKQIIGFDVVETANGIDSTLSLSLKEWSGNISARLIYQLSSIALDHSIK